MQNTTIVKDEWIGKHVTITACSDPTWIGVTGVILDETRHTFLIERNQKQKRIAKKTATFEVDEDGKKITVEGVRLLYRPEERIKKAR